MVTDLRKLLALLSLLGASTVCPAQTPAPPPLPSLSGTLPAPLDASTAKVGTHVSVWLTEPWSGNGCDLRKGAVLEGHVAQVQRRSKTDNTSAIHLVFDRAECSRHKGTPFKATLIALMGPFGVAPPNGQSGVNQAPSLTEGTAVGPPVSGGVRSVATASANNMNIVRSRNVPAYWKLGMVLDVPGMLLDVGTGVDGASVIRTLNQDARLEAQTLLIFLATPMPPAPTPTTTP